MQLYIHVPFCRSRCVYCGFHSQALPMDGVAAGALVDGYLTALLCEMEAWAARVGRCRLSSVFLGGGTPSLLSPEHWQRVFRHMRHVFVLEEQAEITLEGNPESLLVPGYLSVLADMGVNRLSIGAQSMSEQRLRWLGRVHSLVQAEEAVQAARRAGFRNISLDMIWGHPGQTPQAWLEELRAAVKLEPDHLSCYALSLDEGTALTRMVEQGRVVLPEDDDLAAMYTQGSALLRESGFAHYEISNFARPGFECRHNLGYWTGKEYLGLGPSAVGTLGARYWADDYSCLGARSPQHGELQRKTEAAERMEHSIRWSNPADTEAWRCGIMTGNWVPVPEFLSPDIRAQEMVMLGLRTSTGISLAAYQTLAGRSFSAGCEEFIASLYRAGLARQDADNFWLTESGMVVSNAILEYFFEHMNRQMHSVYKSDPPAHAGQAAYSLTHQRS